MRAMRVAVAIATAFVVLFAALGALHWVVAHPARGMAFSDGFDETCRACHGGTMGAGDASR